MLPTFLDLILCSGRNRVRLQPRRLREPRYAVATVAGLLYFAFIGGRCGPIVVLAAVGTAALLGECLLVGAVDAAA